MNKKLSFIISGTLLISSVNGCNSINSNINDNIQNTIISSQNKDAISSWSVLPSMSVPRYNLQANLINNKIYVSGGLNNNIGILDNFDVFDPNTNNWEKLSPLPSPRYIHGSAVLNNKLYLIGGYNFSENIKNLVNGISSKAAISNVDRFDPKTGKWESLPSLNIPRFMPSVAVYNGKIYVAGGASKGQILDSVEVYDPSLNKWKLVSKMFKPRVWGKFVNDGNNLYLIGGSSGKNEFLSSVDKYIPETDTWVENSLPPMKIKKYGFGAVSNEKGIYVVGGSNVEQGFLEAVEFFSFKTKTWTMLSPITPARGGIDIVSHKKGIFVFGLDAWETNDSLLLTHN